MHLEFPLKIEGKYDISVVETLEGSVEVIERQGVAAVLEEDKTREGKGPVGECAGAKPLSKDMEFLDVCFDLSVGVYLLVHSLAEAEDAGQCLVEVELLDQPPPLGLVDLPHDEVSVLRRVQSNKLVEGLNRKRRMSNHTTRLGDGTLCGELENALRGGEVGWLIFAVLEGQSR